jgi:seryl-tRNA synthetase
MLDLKFIRDNIDLVREAVARRKDSAPLDEILELDTTRRQRVTELELFRHTRKMAAQEKAQPIDEEKRLIAQRRGRTLRTKIKELEDEVRNLDTRLEELLLQVPNVPQPTVPVGSGEEDNVVVRSWGEPKSLDFEPAPVSTCSKGWVPACSEPSSPSCSTSIPETTILRKSTLRSWSRGIA